MDIYEFEGSGTGDKAKSDAKNIKKGLTWTNHNRSQNKKTMVNSILCTMLLSKKKHKEKEKA